jgi:hypothetical protein
MEEKKAVVVLNRLLKKDILEPEEKEAVSAAIGLLSWNALAKSRLKALKTRKTKSTEW